MEGKSSIKIIVEMVVDVAKTPIGKLLVAGGIIIAILYAVTKLWLLGLIGGTILFVFSAVCLAE